MVLLKCKFCGYVWDYQGSRDYATCPVCHHKLNVQKYRIDIDEQEIDNWLIEQLKRASEKLYMLYARVVMRPDGRNAGRELLRKCLIEEDEEACRILREIVRRSEEE